MSAIHLDNRLVHYEAFGRGQPIIFLHSWLGSWRYWVPTMELVSERYRTYALDFWGFGDSDRSGDLFTISEYVDMLSRFMERMGIRKANLVGHGLGGMVAIRAAREQSDRFLRLVTVSTPLIGSIVNETMKSGAFSRFLGRNNLTSIGSKLVRQMPIDDKIIQQELYEDTDSLSANVLQGVYDSITDTDLRPALQALDSMPLLAVYGEKDTIVPYNHAEFLNEDSNQPHQLIVLPKANHFVFLEKTTVFSRLITDFIVSEGSPVEIKNEWRRRVNQREYL